MKILAIETSCDESAISLIDAQGHFKDAKTPLKFKVLAHVIASQVELHAAYGGVVPRLAKREHARNLVPLLEQALELAQAEERGPAAAGPRARSHLTIERAGQLQALLAREPELLEQLLQFIPRTAPPPIDAIAVTRGPGLEPALWVGINFARALGLVWDLPVIPVNHLEGHLLSVLAEVEPQQTRVPELKFPLLGLIVSGGHTELVLARDWLRYELLGQTRDDAAGEAFDKVARLLELGYPGGPAIAKLALHGSLHPDYGLPRPMLNSPDYDFSFSGLKTAVRYLIEKLQQEMPTGLTNIHRADLARQFQQAVIDVLCYKTAKAIAEFKPRTVVLGGGVIANQEFREQFTTLVHKKFPKVACHIAAPALATDNATMIGIAAYLQWLKGGAPADTFNLSAAGNLRLA